jgi:hypothetical protein
MTQPLFQRETALASAETGGPAARKAWTARLLMNLSAQDWFIALYFGLLFFALAVGTGPGRADSARSVAVDLLCFSVGIFLTRGGVLRHGSLGNGLVYRFTLFLSVFLSYFQLRNILPAVSSRAIDADILAFDLNVFGFEPSIAWDRFVTPFTTEWFAFFYFGYFFLLSVHIFPMMLAAKNRDMLAHFSMGIFIVFCTGHLLYMVVPGWGPHHHLAGQFQHELHGGVFWGLVKGTVDAGGAQKDIFPSLHTAAPTYLMFFSFRYRKLSPFKYTWAPMAFFCLQIIGATMFLRWHYLIDIFAGLALSTTAVLVGERLMAWEKKRRQAFGVEPTFHLLEYPWSKTPRPTR